MTPRTFDIATSHDGPGGELLSAEWLLTNGRGSYAASTAAGVNTRKYHGLLVAARRQPGERAVMLAALAEELTLDGQRHQLGCFRFANIFHPRGDQYLVRFQYDPRTGSVRHTWQVGGATLSRTLALARDADVLAVSYELSGESIAGAALRVAPFLACRPYHHNRRAGDAESFDVSAAEVDDAAPSVAAGGVIRVCDRASDLPALAFDAGDGSFVLDPCWWYRFFYQAEADRGEDPWEDLFVPGRFELTFDAAGRAELSAAVEPFAPMPAAGVLTTQRTHRSMLLRSAGLDASDADAPLVLAADDFVADASPAAGGAVAVADATTLLAGFPWFADWGRDAFIALPGLLLCTGREELARRVLRRFAGAIRHGLVPNRFSDTGGGADYNSVDASLWFINAAFGWADATERWDDLHAELLTPILAILDAFHEGTDFGIRVDDDGLLTCGDANTQLTWMDAQVDGRPVTPRFGKPVEVNALYGRSLRLVADRLARRRDEQADAYEARWRNWAGHFAAAFRSPRGGLVDCIRPDGSVDDSIRPNQVLAVALLGDGAPLGDDLAREIVDLAVDKLLTPFGLRSLAASEPGYRGRCVGSRQERDGAYHQGTVWAWLIGPFIEAWLTVSGNSRPARRQAADWLAPLIEHMDSAGVAQISEIFDGNAPHTPRGCFAQAWSVAEVLRARRLIEG